MEQPVSIYELLLRLRVKPIYRKMPKWLRPFEKEKRP